jgi:alpha-tubulin suppressor-like RCC1 family protein
VCWGDDGNGQAGDAVYAHACAAKGDCTLAETPVAVDAVRVAVGGRHTCAIDRDGVTWCWGDNTYGQLGHGGRDAINAPAPVPEAALPAGATDIVAGDTLSCAVTAYARAWCWGLLGYEAE